MDLYSQSKVLKLFFIYKTKLDSQITRNIKVLVCLRASHDNIKFLRIFIYSHSFLYII